MLAHMTKALTVETVRAFVVVAGTVQDVWTCHPSRSLLSAKLMVAVADATPLKD
jgi:hypothetical protein